MDKKSTQVRTTEILVVEDNIDDLKFLSEILKKANYKVRPAADGELALRSLKAKKPDIILLDLNLPGIDGIEVCRQIKANPETIEIPVIFISAFGKSELKLKAFDTGAVDYITKPFETTEILARIRTHLNIYQLQQKLKESEEKYRTFINTASDLMCITDEEGKFTEVNESMINKLEYSRNELIGNHFRTILTKKSIEKDLLPNWDKFVKNGKISIETIFLSKKGNEIYCELKGIGIYDDNNKFIGSRAVIHDLTQRKQAEETLQESEEKFRILTQTSPMAIMLYQKDKWIYANSAAELICGYNLSELKNMYFWEFVAPEYQDLVKKRGTAREKGLQQVPNYEFKIITKSGQEKYVFLNGSTVKINGVFSGLITVLDITERKQAEETLKKRMNELKIFNEAAVGRELKIIELKKEINELLVKTGQKPKYEIIV